MSLAGGGELYEFGPFRLEPTERLLLRDGRPVSLPPKAYDLLVVLVAHAGRLVAKEDLLKAVWPETFVEEANLSYTVSVLRKALGDDNEPYRYVETVAKRGYRFKELVRSSAATTVVVAAPPHTRRVRWPVAVAVGVALFLAAIAVTWSLREKPPSPRFARLALIPPKGVLVEDARISPNGRYVAFV